MLASLSTEIGRSKLKICAKRVMPLLSALQIDSNLNALRRWNMTICYLDPQREFNTAALILNSRSDVAASANKLLRQVTRNQFGGFKRNAAIKHSAPSQMDS